MGIPATTDFTSLSDGGEDQSLPILIVSWIVLKGEDSFYLLYKQDHKVSISAPLFRFNKFGPRNLRLDGVNLNVAQAWDCDGKIYIMVADCYATTGGEDWALSFWEKFWAEVGLSTKAEPCNNSFYIPALGVEHQSPRATIPKTKIAINPNHRHYNLSHLRIMAGLDATKSGHENSDDIDFYIGAKKEKETGKAAEQIWSCGGVTLCYVMVPKHDGSNSVDITFSMSVCNIKDHYNRKVGGSMAMMKLEEVLQGKPTQVFSKDGRLHRFHGTGKVTLQINPEYLRTTTVDGTMPYYEFTAPFFPANAMLHWELLNYVTYTLDVGIPDDALPKTCNTLECVKSYLLERLDQFGLEENLPKIFIDPVNGTQMTMWGTRCNGQVTSTAKETSRVLSEAC